VECSHFNFRAIAKRELFYKDEFVGPDELFLGTGCRAINVRDCELEFNYPVSLCGITMQVREATILPSGIYKVLELLLFICSYYNMLLLLSTGATDLEEG
jgi:hypothetical protein